MLLAIVILVGAATLIIPSVLRSDFRKNLAKQLNVNAACAESLAGGGICHKGSSSFARHIARARSTEQRHNI